MVIIHNCNMTLYIKLWGCPGGLVSSQLFYISGIQRFYLGSHFPWWKRFLPGRIQNWAWKILFFFFFKVKTLLWLLIKVQFTFSEGQQCTKPSATHLPRSLKKKKINFTASRLLWLQYWNTFVTVTSLTCLGLQTKQMPNISSIVLCTCVLWPGSLWWHLWWSLFIVLPGSLWRMKDIENVNHAGDSNLNTKYQTSQNYYHFDKLQ